MAFVTREDPPSDSGSCLVMPSDDDADAKSMPDLVWGSSDSEGPPDLVLDSSDSEGPPGLTDSSDSDGALDLPSDSGEDDSDSDMPSDDWDHAWRCRCGCYQTLDLQVAQSHREHMQHQSTADHRLYVFSQLQQRRIQGFQKR